MNPPSSHASPSPEEKLQELEERIAALTEKIAPLEAELTELKRQRARIKGGLSSAAKRQARASERNPRILAMADERRNDKYRRGAGRNNSIAEEFGLSIRQISSIINKGK